MLNELWNSLKCARWARVEEAVAGFSPETDYLVLQTRVPETGRFRMCARVGLQPAELNRFLQADLELDDDDGDEDEEDRDQDDGDDDAPSTRGGGYSFRGVLEATPPSRQPAPASRKELLAAALSWLKDAVCNTAEPGRTGYRLRAYSPKGEQVLSTLTFEVEAPELTYAVSNLPAMAPEMKQLSVRAHSLPFASLPELPVINSRDPFSAYRALAGYYAQYGQVLNQGYSHLLGLSVDMVDGLYGQLRASHSHRDTLVSHLIEQRLSLEVGMSRESLEVQRDEKRTELAQAALAQLGEATRTVFLAQGLSPESSELLQQLSQSPELMETLRDARVRQLMADPNNLRGLAGLLNQAAGNAPPAQAQATPAGARPPGAASPAQVPRVAHATMGSPPPWARASEGTAEEEA